MRIIAALDNLLVKYPHSTRGTIAITLAGAADYITQTIFEKRKWDKMRSLRVGFVSMSINTTYGYLWFQKIIPAIWKTSFLRNFSLTQLSLTQVGIDLVVYLPLSTGYWLGLNEFLKKADQNDTYNSIYQNFWSNYLKWASFWTVSNMFTYRFVPLKYRLLFMITVNFGWQVIIIWSNDVILEYGHKHTKPELLKKD